MSSYKDVEVKCPFYKNMTQDKISCEGVARGSVISVVFTKRDKKERYLSEFCCGNYKSCALAQMLYKKYQGN